MGQAGFSELGGPSQIVTMASTAVVALFAVLTYWGNRRFSVWTRKLREPAPILVGARITQPQSEPSGDSLDLVLELSNPGTAPLYLRTAIVRVNSESGSFVASGLEIRSFGKPVPDRLAGEIPAGHGRSVILETRAALQFKTKGTVTMQVFYVSGAATKSVTYKTTLNWCTQSLAYLDPVDLGSATRRRLPLGRRKKRELAQGRGMRQASSKLRSLLLISDCSFRRAGRLAAVRSLGRMRGQPGCQTW
jgi:hypothetical protein